MAINQLPRETVEWVMTLFVFLIGVERSRAQQLHCMESEQELKGRLHSSPCLRGFFANEIILQIALMF